MGRLIAIGDVHGHLTALQAVLAKLEPQADDTLVFLGDLIDRGPNSRGVVQAVLDLEQTCKVVAIMGNHEEMLIACYNDPGAVNYWLKFGGKEALESYGGTGTPMERVRGLPREHLLFYARMLNYWEEDEFIFTHASYDPARPPSQWSGEVNRWQRFDPGLGPHSSGRKVVVGHTPAHRLRDLGHAACIDTGCGVLSGGYLTAWDVRAKQVWWSRP